MGNKKQDISPSDILAWADGLVGVSMKESAGKQACSERAIANRRSKVKDFIARDFDINNYRLPLYALYPLTINSLTHNLKKCDTTITIALLKGLQILVDKQQTESQPFGNLTDDELRQLFSDLHDLASGIKPKPKADPSEGSPGKPEEIPRGGPKVLYTERATG